MKNESAYLFENSEKTKLLEEIFSTGKHLKKFGFSNTLYDTINRELEQASEQAVDETP